MSALAHETQPLVEVALAYDGLEPELRERLTLALNGELTLAQTHRLACQLLAQAKPVVLAMVITRLIVMTNDD